MTSKHIETTLIGAGRGKRYTQGSVNPVTQRASSLVFDSVAAKKHATAQRAHGELFYGRRGTLTHFALQDAMVELEGGAGAVLTNTGMSAILLVTTVFLKPGDLLVAPHDCYGGSYRLFDSLAKRGCYRVQFVDQSDEQALRAALAWGKTHLPGEKTVCIISPENQASLALAKKVGFSESHRSEYHQSPIVVMHCPL